MEEEEQQEQQEFENYIEINEYVTKYYNDWMYDAIINKTLKEAEEEADYDGGKVVSSFKKYYSNSKLKSEYIYKDKKIVSSAEYFPTGVKSSESDYNDKGSILSTLYFDASGQKYYEEVFNSKEIKYIRQYAKNTPKPTEINLSRKAFEIRNLDVKLPIT